MRQLPLSSVHARNGVRTGNSVHTAKSTREAVLFHLKKAGPCTASSLGEALGISSMAARVHLQRLAGDGLVSMRLQRKGVGRPAQLYALTPESERLFPSAYETLALSLLDALDDLGGEAAVRNALHEYHLQSVRWVREVGADQTDEGRLRLLAGERSQAGFMAEITKVDGGLRMRQFHCPIAQIARSRPAACEEELAVFRSLFEDGKLTRTRCLMEGDSVCEYLLNPQATGAD